MQYDQHNEHDERAQRTATHSRHAHSTQGVDHEAQPIGTSRNQQQRKIRPSTTHNRKTKKTRKQDKERCTPRKTLRTVPNRTEHHAWNEMGRERRKNHRSSSASYITIIDRNWSKTTDSTNVKTRTTRAFAFDTTNLMLCFFRIAASHGCMLHSSTLIAQQHHAPHLIVYVSCTPSFATSFTIH
jgi:hypothetical protein